jgi:hypothetical protein
MKNLFNLFKNEQIKDQPSKEEISVGVLEKYSTEIEQVHHEFEIAGEKLYQEALKVLDENKIENKDKIERLRKIGFVNVKEVKEIEEKENKIKVSEETAKMIEYYKIRYPLNKFITKEQVETICQKYGLIYGEIIKYKGFVPEKNLNEIESFKLKDEDKELELEFRFGSADNPRSWYSLEELKKPNMFDNQGWYGNGETKKYDESINAGVPKNDHCRYKEGPSLFIAAPIKDFDIDKMEIKDYKLSNKPVPDPVVMQKVKLGFLLLSAWGEEASDPIVLNPISN